MWLVSCQGDRVVSADGCLPPPMPHRPLPPPSTHLSTHTQFSTHSLLHFSISPSTCPALHLFHAHHPLSAHQHPLPSTPQPTNIPTIPLTHYPHHDSPRALKHSQASPTCQHITHPPTSHPSSQQPRTLPPALLSTHTSTHYPKHPPIYPLPKTPTHPPTQPLFTSPTYLSASQPANTSAPTYQVSSP